MKTYELDQKLSNLDNVHIIAGDIYCKTYRAVSNVLELLNENYDCINNPNKNEEYFRHDDQNYWHCRLKSKKVLKCKQCGHCNPDQFVPKHNSKCENCGEVIYQYIIDGKSKIKFALKSDVNRNYIYGLTIKYVDNDYIEFKLSETSRSPFDLPIEKVHILIEKYRFQNNYRVPLKDVIVYDVYERYIGYKEAVIFNGAEYGPTWSKNSVPLRDYYSLFLKELRSPVSPTLHQEIILAAGMVYDCGYYYQDGRQVFSYTHLDDMRKYVEHFTELPIDQWNKIVENAPLDGPGFIKHVAKGISGEAAKIENKPNIGNFIIGFSKLTAGQPLTDNEADAMIDAVKDDTTMDMITKVFL